MPEHYDCTVTGLTVAHIHKATRIEVRAVRHALGADPAIAIDADPAESIPEDLRKALIDWLDPLCTLRWGD
jgi:hypothetical protein